MIWVVSVCFRVLDVEENKNFFLNRKFYVITMGHLYQHVCVMEGRFQNVYVEDNCNFFLKRDFYVITLDLLYQIVDVTGGRFQNVCVMGERFQIWATWPQI